jgi:hypothetical protein
MPGLPFSFAHHFAAANAQPAPGVYRDAFWRPVTPGPPSLLEGRAVG